jgi:hypothetical protein
LLEYAGTMSNKHQKHYSNQPPRHQDRQGKAVIGAPTYQSATDRHRAETRDRGVSHIQDVSAGAVHKAPEPQKTSARPESEKSFTASVLQAIRDNPIPVALVGVGLGAGATWLIISNRRSRSSRASQLVQHVLQRAGSRSRELEHSIEELLPRSPLAIGAALLTAAAGVTLAVMSTRPQKSWLGKRREQLTDVAQGLVHGALETVEAVARQLTEAL